MLASDAPRVSIVLVFFNDERFLGDAIDSVRGQSFTDWELILVDDGSSDGSSELARSHAQLQPSRIRYLEHPGHENRGISAARNLGLEACQAACVALLDSDDLWMPEKLADQVAILDAQPLVAMTYCRSLYWWTWEGTSNRRDTVLPAGVPEDCVLEAPRLLPLLVSNKAAPALPCSLMFRTQVARHVGGFEESFPGLYEDQVFTAKIAAEYPVWASSECGVKYRQHPGSISAASQRVGQTRMAVARARYLDWLGRYLSSIGMRDPAVWREWSRQQWMYRHFRSEDPAVPGATRRDLWRWVKKWILKSEAAVLPAALRRHLWRQPNSLGKV
jgi:glycosyltransferase involved in cell wall biosynthesis